MMWYIAHTANAREGKVMTTVMTLVMILILVPPYINEIPQTMSAGGIKKGDNNNKIPNQPASRPKNIL